MTFSLHHDQVPAPHDRPLAQVDTAEGLGARRRRALAEVLIEISSSPGGGRAPVIALRSFGSGCVALALGGVFDPVARARVRALTDDLDRWATVELIVDLSQLLECPATLIRVLTGLRMRRLVAGARVELHSPPRELLADLGHAPATAFTLHDAVDAPPPRWPPRRSGARARDGGAG